MSTNAKSSDWDLTCTWHLPDTHLNLTWPSSEHNVFDIGAAGNACTVARQAWDKRRQFGYKKVEGCHIDKRLLFLALGDRSQIFSNIGFDINHFIEKSMIISAELWDDVI